MRIGAGAAEPGTAVRSEQAGIGLRLIESCVVQRGPDLLAAEEGEVGSKEDWRERLVSIGHVDGFARRLVYSSQKPGNYHVPSAVKWA